jgi:hypothetical protein
VDPSSLEPAIGHDLAVTDLQPRLTAAPPKAEAFDADEFVRRTAVREGSAAEQASQHAPAVFGTIKEDVAAVDRLRDRLPPDYADLFRRQPGRDYGWRDTSVALPRTSWPGRGVAGMVPSRPAW